MNLDLKQKLAELKRNLLEKHQFSNGIGKEKGKKTVRPIDILSQFIDSNPDVRAELSSVGFDWPEPVATEPVADSSNQDTQAVWPHPVQDEQDSSQDVPFLTDSVLDAVISDIIKEDDTREIVPVPTVTDKEVLFNYKDTFYKRNTQSGCIWQWKKYLTSWVWDYMGISGKLRCQDASEIERASYAALSSFVESKKENNPEVEWTDRDKNEYVLFSVEENGSKRWFKVQKEWHTVWEWTEAKYSYNKTKHWQWLGYPKGTGNAYSQKIDETIDDAAVEAIKKYKEEFPAEKNCYLVGEKKPTPTYSTYTPTYSSYSYKPPEDKEADIDCETAIFVDENIVELDDIDIGKLKGSFTKKSEVGGHLGYFTKNTPAFNKSSSYYDDYDTDDWYGGQSKKGSNTFPVTKSSQTFPESKGTTSSPTHFTSGNAVSGSDDNCSHSNTDGVVSSKSYASTPLEGYGDTIKVGDWVIVTFEGLTKTSVEYDGEPRKVMGYYKAPNTSLFIDLVDESGKISRALYQGPGWKKTFKITNAPEPKEIQKPLVGSNDMSIDPIDNFIDDEESPLR